MGESSLIVFLILLVVGAFIILWKYTSGATGDSLEIIARYHDRSLALKAKEYLKERTFVAF
jgi:hypothetical protein